VSLLHLTVVCIVFWAPGPLQATWEATSFGPAAASASRAAATSWPALECRPPWSPAIMSEQGLVCHLRQLRWFAWVRQCRAGFGVPPTLSTAEP